MSVDLALVKKDVVDVVLDRVQNFQQSGKLRLPENYSPENAMTSAWLILQSTVDRNEKPALEVCTKDSIANALLDMAVQGLNPVKKQGYFIVYGNKLTFQRSYFGTMAVAMEVDNTIVEIISEIVYEGDKVIYRINRGKKEIFEHEQDLENVDKAKIKAAYCIIIDKNGQIKKTEIMTFDEIKQAWKQSKTHPVDDKGNIKVNSTHDKFTAEMAKKTVINRACKPIINGSSDSNLFKDIFNRNSEVVAEDEATQEIAENANGETIDVAYNVVDDQTGTVVTEPVTNAEPEKDTLHKASEIAEAELNKLDDVKTTDGPGF